MPFARLYQALRPFTRTLARGRPFSHTPIPRTVSTPDLFSPFLPPTMVDTHDRLTLLRAQMAEAGVQAYLVPSEDAHGSEYVPDADARRAWISGFSGSAGTAVVLETEAHLWTDGRYHQQAAKELSSDWTLHRHGLPHIKSWQEFLSTLPPSTAIGLDPTLLSLSDHALLLPTLRAPLVPLATNLVDQAWIDRPARPAERVFLHGVDWAGEAAGEKVGRVRREVRERNGRAWGVVVSALDEVAWMLNLRGGDIAFNPVFAAYLVVPVASAPTLFVEIEQLPQDVYDHLQRVGVLIEPYDSVVSYLSTIGASLQEGEFVVFPSKANFALASAIGLSKLDVYRGPVGDLKAIKNAVEIEGFRQCHLRDGLALTRYFSWLERQLNAGVQLSESQAADHLESLRKELPLFKGLSFPTISSTGANASVIHYQPDPVNSATIDRNAIYLCDSGAHYSDGTTDTTRTLHFGEPTKEEVRAFTRVLQGHIAMDTMVFPEGTTGYLLDAFARRPLWEDGLDYRHGTGHGVGSFLNVHEGPHGVGTRIAYNDCKLQAGMTLSNEPGYYEDGKFGIRIENIVIVQPATTPNNFGDTGFLRFENVTMVPIQTKLVDATLLSPKELAWLNAYHAEVREKLSGPMERTGDVEALQWLEEATREVVL